MKKSVFVAAAVLLLTACNQNKGTNSDTQNVIELTTDALNLADYADRVVVIDFNATWCPPCREYSPTFHQVAEEQGDKAIFMSVDVDVCGTVAREYGVEYIPQTTIISKDRANKVNHVGPLTAEELTAMIDSIAAL